MLVGEAPPASLFLLTTLMPPINRIKASTPRMTARVTIAPMTPATALEMPPPDDEEEAVTDGEEEVEVELEAQIPVVLPQAEHQSA